MPNSPLIISAATLIAPLEFVVDGYPRHVHKLTTRTGGEPIEDGRQVTDHVVAAPKVLALTGSVSDMENSDKPRLAWRLIEALHERSEPVMVTTEWGVYPEMTISRCEAQPAGRGLSFEMELTEILRASSTIRATVPSSALTGNARNRGGVVSRGRVPSIPYGSAAFQ